MLYTQANDRINTALATTSERARHALMHTSATMRAYAPTYKKVGGLHFIRVGRLGIQFFWSKR